MQNVFYGYPSQSTVFRNVSTNRKIKYLGYFLSKSNNFLNEREIFKILFNTKGFYICRSKVSSFYGPMICLLDIAHHTFTLGEIIAASMVVKGCVAAQVRQLCLFTTSEV